MLLCSHYVRYFVRDITELYAFCQAFAKVDNVDLFTETIAKILLFNLINGFKQYKGYEKFNRIVGITAIHVF